jgi:hypothetical protein
MFNEQGTTDPIAGVLLTVLFLYFSDSKFVFIQGPGSRTRARRGEPEHL